MRLTDHEKAMLAGALGEPRRLALEHQIKVGRFFDAADMVEISQVHIMADTEALGEAGVEFLERVAAYPEADRRTVVPAVTDPRGADFNAYKRLKQEEAWIGQEARAIAAFQALGVLMTDTCINYQTVIPPVLGEHVAFGDTGSSIYTNSVLGARTNFEGGPSALAAALTGRTPRYGFHLDECRRGKILYQLDTRPEDWADWGAAGDTTDDPRKDVDNTGLYGPENIYLERAADGRYHVMVEYWGSGTTDTSEVSVTLGGRTVWHGTRAMNVHGGLAGPSSHASPVQFHSGAMVLKSATGS